MELNNGFTLLVPPNGFNTMPDTLIFDRVRIGPGAVDYIARDVPMLRAEWRGQDDLAIRGHQKIHDAINAWPWLALFRQPTYFQVCDCGFLQEKTRIVYTEAPSPTRLVEVAPDTPAPSRACDADSTKGYNPPHTVHYPPKPAPTSPPPPPFAKAAQKAYDAAVARVNPDWRYQHDTSPDGAANPVSHIDFAGKPLVNEIPKDLPYTIKFNERRAPSGIGFVFEAVNVPDLRVYVTASVADSRLIYRREHAVDTLAAAIHRYIDTHHITGAKPQRFECINESGSRHWAHDPEWPETYPCTIVFDVTDATSWGHTYAARNSPGLKVRYTYPVRSVGGTSGDYVRLAGTAIEVGIRQHVKASTPKDKRPKRFVVYSNGIRAFAQKIDWPDAVKQPKPPPKPQPVQDFRAFIKQVDPAFQWTPAAHALVNLLQEVSDGTNTRLIVRAPRGWGKSHIVSELFTAYWRSRHESLPALVANGDDATTTFAYRLAQGSSRYYAVSGGSIDKKIMVGAAGRPMVPGYRAGLMVLDNPGTPGADWYRKTEDALAPNGAVIYLQSNADAPDYPPLMYADNRPNARLNVGDDGTFYINRNLRAPLNLSTPMPDDMAKSLLDRLERGESVGLSVRQIPHNGPLTSGNWPDMKWSRDMAAKVAEVLASGATQLREKSAAPTPKAAPTPSPTIALRFTLCGHGDQRRYFAIALNLTIAYPTLKDGEQPNVAVATAITKALRIFYAGQPEKLPTQYEVWENGKLAWRGEAGPEPKPIIAPARSSRARTRQTDYRGL